MLGKIETLALFCRTNCFCIVSHYWITWFLSHFFANLTRTRWCQRCSLTFKLCTEVIFAQMLNPFFSECVQSCDKLDCVVELTHPSWKKKIQQEEKSIYRLGRSCKRAESYLRRYVSILTSFTEVANFKTRK
jgi:hypothetical protein